MEILLKVFSKSLKGLIAQFNKNLKKQIFKL